MWTVKLTPSLADKQPFAQALATNDAGGDGEFSYAGRVLLDDGKNLTDFVAAAKAALAWRDGKKDSLTGASAQLESELNK